MAKNASPGWIALRAFIDALPVSRIGDAAKKLDGTASDHKALRSLAYNYSKRLELEYSDTLFRLQNVGPSLTDAPPRVEPTPSAPDAPLPSGELADAIAKLSTAFEALRSSGIDVAKVRAIVREETKDIAISRVEIKNASDDTVARLNGLFHKLFPTLIKVCSARQADGYAPAIWISGPPGAGKTHAARAVAKALGRDFYFDGALSMSHEVLGFKDAAGTYHETAFYKGYTSKSVYLYDECDGSENAPLLACNAALANGCASFPVGMRERHPDSILIAGANTWGFGATADFIGRNKLDGAFLDRFPVRLFWDYDTALELALCGNENWARRVQGARAKARMNGVKVLITPRATIAGAALLAAGLSPDEAAELTYLSNLTPEQRRIVEA